MAIQSASAAAFQKALPLNPAQLDDSRLAQALDLAQGAGVTQIQSYATWWYLARNGPGSYDWSSIDRLVAAAEARGMDVVLQLNGTPDWVHPDLQSSVGDMAERIWYPPVRNAAELDHWSNFVRDLMTRYRGRVSQYEIWNEQNWSHFWKPAPNPGDYARLLRTAYVAGREADPDASIAFGGMTTNDVGYLRAFYDSAESLWPGEPAGEGYYFDVLGVHPYSAERSPRVLDPRYVDQGQYGEIDRNFLGIRRLKALMDAREGPGKQIFIGEYGFSTTKTWMEAVPDEVRAQHLRDAYALAAAEGYVTGMAWYGFLPNTGTGPEWTIVDEGLNPSLTFEALREAPSGEVPSLITGSPDSSGAPPARRGPRVTAPRLGRLEFVAVVRCGTEDCGAVARGNLVAGERKRHRFRTKVPATAEAGSSARLELKIPRAARKAASRVLRRGGKARAEIKVKASDAAGNAVLRKRRLPVRT